MKNPQWKYFLLHPNVQELFTSDHSYSNTKHFEATNAMKINKLSLKVKALNEKVRRRNKKIKNMKGLLKYLKEQQLIADEQHLILKHNFGGMVQELFENKP